MSSKELVCVDEEAGLWSARQITNEGFSVCTTILRLSDGSLALVSPTRGLEDFIEELGTPSLLIAPNHYHYLGLTRYMSRWPQARALASAGAMPRLIRKSGVTEFGSLDRLREALPAHAEILEAPGLKNGEVLLRVKTRAGIVWSVSDALFNMPVHPTGLVGLFCRVTRTSGGLRIGRTFTGLGVRDKKLYGAWLRQQLESDKPSVLIPGHGDIDRGDDLYARLDLEIRGVLRA